MIGRPLSITFSSYSQLTSQLGSPPGGHRWKKRDFLVFLGAGNGWTQVARPKKKPEIQQTFMKLQVKLKMPKLHLKEAQLRLSEPLQKSTRGLSNSTTCVWKWQDAQLPNSPQYHQPLFFSGYQTHWRNELGRWIQSWSFFASQVEQLLTTVGPTAAALASPWADKDMARTWDIHQCRKCHIFGGEMGWWHALVIKQWVWISTNAGVLLYMAYT